MIKLAMLFVLLRAFHRLAKKHNKIGWRYVASGFIAFYVWAFLSSALFYCLLELWQHNAITLIPEDVIQYLAFAIGFMMSWIYYSSLKLEFRKPNNFSTHNHWLADLPLIT